MNGSQDAAAALDETDLALLEQVEADFDVSLETIADELGLSKSAVHYRLNKLEANGVIRGVTADVDPLALGLEMTAVTDVMVTHETGYSEAIGESLVALDGVEHVYYTMGDVDFVVVSRVQSRDQLNDLIDRIVAVEGVNETASKFVLDEFADHAVSSNLTPAARNAILEPADR